jgi:tRNA(fMet)-specific endonuclease VapC
MKYLLDTNICIHFFRGQYDLFDKLSQTGLINCAISEITLAELIYGAENSPDPIKNLSIVQDFTTQISVLPIFDSISLYGKEKARLRKAGIPIGDFDLFIGCTAIAKDMIVVTENIKEFKRISNIKLENWVER